jgi:hypothetical protein
VELRRADLAQLLTVRVQHRGMFPADSHPQINVRWSPSRPPRPLTQVRNAVPHRQGVPLAIVEVNPHRRLALVDPDVVDDFSAVGRVRDQCALN